MRYLIEIPKPSAKRLENRKLFIEHIDGFSGVGTLKFESTIPIGENVVEIEFDQELELKDLSFLDKSYYNVFVEFSNPTKTRCEYINVCPITLE